MNTSNNTAANALQTATNDDDLELDQDLEVKAVDARNLFGLALPSLDIL